MVVIMIFRDEFFVMKVFLFSVWNFFVYFLYVFNEMLKVLFFFDNFLLDIYFV